MMQRTFVIAAMLAGLIAQTGWAGPPDKSPRPLARPGAAAAEPPVEVARMVGDVVQPRAKPGGNIAKAPVPERVVLVSGGSAVRQSIRPALRPENLKRRHVVQASGQPGHHTWPQRRDLRRQRDQGRSAFTDCGTDQGVRRGRAGAGDVRRWCHALDPRNYGLHDCQSSEWLGQQVGKARCWPPGWRSDRPEGRVTLRLPDPQQQEGREDFGAWARSGDRHLGHHPEERRGDQRAEGLARSSAGQGSEGHAQIRLRLFRNRSGAECQQVP